MKLAKINADDLDWVARRMRRQDMDEIYATRWNDDPAELCAGLLAGGDFGWVAGNDNGTPIAAFGAVPAWPGVWEVWMFATDKWPEIALGVTRFVKRVMIPSLEDVGVHRAQCRSKHDHLVAHAWLESLGAYKESELRNYGRNAELFYLYCWTRDPKGPQY